MQADAHAHRRIGVGFRICPEGALHRHGAEGGALRAREDDHEAVAERLDLVAAVGGHFPTEHVVVHPDEIDRALVAKPVV